MRAVVIGGAGHIGNAITRALVDRTADVTVCGRRRTPPVTLAGLPVNYVTGDAEAPGQLDQWIDGQDLVVDAAAPYPLDVFSVARAPGTDPLFDAERRTRRLLAALSKSDAQLLYVSSFVTLARPRGDAHRFRSDMIRLAHPYFQVKDFVESQIRDAVRCGVRAVIVNPTYCLGPWDLRDRRLCTIPLLLRGEIPGSITQMLNVVDVRDVASAALRAVYQEKTGDPILLGGHDISVRDLYSMICQLGKVPPPGISVDAGLAMLGTYGTEILFAVLGREAPLRSGGMMMATAFDYQLPTNGLPALGVTPRALSETVTDAIDWYRRIGYC